MHRLGPVVPALHSSSETCPKASGRVEVSLLGRPCALIAAYGRSPDQLQPSRRGGHTLSVLPSLSVYRKESEVRIVQCKLLTSKCRG